MSKIKITYIETTHVKDVKYRKYLRWWSEHTKKEQRMLDRSVHFFKKNLLFAVFAYILGALGDRMGPAKALFISQCISLVGTYLYMKVFRHEKKQIGTLT